jgi:hypothetical protein
METSIQDCMKIISEAREKTPNDPSPPFKEKEKGGEGRSMFGGQWKVPCLVANGMFQDWWPMECEGETPFHLFHFPPNNLYPNLQFFPLTLRFYFTMVLSRYSRLPFPFLRSINHNCAPQCNKTSTPSLSFDFD